MKSEKDVKARIKKILDCYEWYWWCPPANGFGKSGISDFNALWKGTFMAIEAKFGGNKPTSLQIGYLNSVRNEDGMAFVVDEKNIDWLEAWCMNFKRATQAISRGEKVDEFAGASMLNAISELTNKTLDI
ncbi:MAG: hypothetical protein M3R04_03475 [bacterium]|nr:hypothetical protein [bacterium]